MTEYHENHELVELFNFVICRRLKWPQTAHVDHYQDREKEDAIELDQDILLEKGDDESDYDSPCYHDEAQENGGFTHLIRRKEVES